MARGGCLRFPCSFACVPSANGLAYLSALACRSRNMKRRGVSTLIGEEPIYPIRYGEGTEKVEGTETGLLKTVEVEYKVCGLLVVRSKWLVIQQIQ